MLFVTFGARGAGAGCVAATFEVPGVPTSTTAAGCTPPHQPVSRHAKEFTDAYVARATESNGANIDTAATCTLFGTTRSSAEKTPCSAKPCAAMKRNTVSAVLEAIAIVRICPCFFAQRARSACRRLCSFRGATFTRGNGSNASAFVTSTSLTDFNSRERSWCHARFFASCCLRKGTRESASTIHVLPERRPRSLPSRHKREI